MLTDDQFRKKLFNCMSGIDRDELIINYVIPEYIIEEYVSHFTHKNWMTLSEFYPMSDDFINKYLSRISWNRIGLNKNIKEDFFDLHLELKSADKYRYHINSNFQTFCFNILEQRKFSVDFLDKHIDCLSDWRLIEYQQVDDEFINRYVDKINWKDVSTFCSLSEDFIGRWSSYLDWSLLSLYQKFSKEFVFKHKDKFNVKNLRLNIKLGFLIDEIV